MGATLFRPLRYDVEFDLDAGLAHVPPSAACKGIFASDMVARVRGVDRDVDLCKKAGIESRRFVAFKDYPYTDFLRLTNATAEVLHPNVPRAEGIRRVAQHAYDALLDSHIGKVFVGVFGGSPDRILLQAPRAQKVALNFGEISVEKVGPRAIVYHFRSVRALLGIFQPGVVEGTMRYCGAAVSTSIAAQDLANADLRIEW